MCQVAFLHHRVITHLSDEEGQRRFKMSFLFERIYLSRIFSVLKAHQD